MALLDFAAVAVCGSQRPVLAEQGGCRSFPGRTPLALASALSPPQKVQANEPPSSDTNLTKKQREPA
jgi:hypothetical protein